MKWEPVESAPKDGTIMLLTDGERVHEGYFFRLSGFPYRVGGKMWTKFPTHWMPMPEPPTIK